MRISAAVAASLFAVFATAAPFDRPTQPADAVFNDKPYSIDLREIASLDPKPLQVSEFFPDPEKRVQGVRVISDGQVFPYTYEVITFLTTVSVTEALERIVEPLSKREDIVLLKSGETPYLGVFVNYYQRVSREGRPHHISSNYIFVRDGNVFHIIGTSFGPMMIPRATWGDPKRDENADRAAIMLLRSLRTK